MARFNYVAVDKQGKREKGMMEAVDEQDLKKKLRLQGLVLVSFTMVGKSSKTKGFKFQSSVNSYDLTLITRQMATMLESGIALLRVIGIIEKQAEKPKLKEMFGQIKNDVSQGQTLSSALAKNPKYFDKLYVSMVKAGEASGSLDVVLVRLAKSKEDSEELKGRVKGAMIYPVIVVAVSFIIVYGLMSFVVPRFVEMFAGAGMEMPALTQVVINISAVMAKFWHVILVAVVGGLYLLIKTIKTPKGKEKFDKFVLKIPMIGTLLRKVSVARFTRTMATLLSSGVPILLAFDIASETSGNTVISKAVVLARNSIKEGNTIAKPLEQSGEFPVMVTQMIEVGEESGTITEMLNKISDFMETDIKQGIQALVSAMEPLAIVIMAVVVGTIVIALFLPLFSISDAIGG
ncbi:MAG: type II secretion system F family protein [Fusobacteriaceae bacterium]|nr:type II secretion system F family protein [Fusobacteriaceae bacterium]